MALVQMFGVQRLGFGTGMQQRFVDPALLTQLLDRQVEGMTDHLQAQACQVLQLLSHRAGRGIGRIQRPLVEIARMGHAIRRRWRQLGDQHRRLGPLWQHAQQDVCQLRLPGQKSSTPMPLNRLWNSAS